jgi:F-type H+-transporting ATPase subunit delta
VKVSKEVRDEIIGLMEDYTKGNIDLHENVDEDLIGGFVLTFEDKQFDSSLRNRINKLKKEFEQNPYIREI